MKIVLIGPVYPYRGGIAHFTTRLAKTIKELNHGVEIISFKRQYPKFLYPGKSDFDPSKEIIAMPAKRILDPSYPWTWWNAENEILNFDPDIVVIQWWTTFWALAYGILTGLLTKKGIKVCYLIHNVYPHEKRFYDSVLVKFALSKTENFIALSKNQELILSALFPHANIKYSPHPIYDIYSNKRIAKNFAKEDLGIPLDRKLALFFGIVRPYKGLKLLIKALGLLKKMGQQVHLLVGGEFWEDVEEYRELILKEEIQDWITIHNRYIPNEEVPTFFSAADFFVAPYNEGTQSGAVKIALGFGLPIVASQIILDTSEFYKDHVQVFPVGNVSELAKAIISISNVTSKPGIINPTDNDWKTLVDMLEQFALGTSL